MFFVSGLITSGSPAKKLAMRFFNFFRKVVSANIVSVSEWGLSNKLILENTIPYQLLSEYILSKHKKLIYKITRGWVDLNM